MVAVQINNVMKLSTFTKLLAKLNNFTSIGSLESLNIQDCKGLNDIGNSADNNFSWNCVSFISSQFIAKKGICHQRSNMHHQAFTVSACNRQSTAINNCYCDYLTHYCQEFSDDSFLC